MHLTVFDSKRWPIFTKAQLSSRFPRARLTYIRAPRERATDGSIIGRTPVKTTHLVLRALDRISNKDVARLPALRYVGICSNGWWDHYFDIEILRARSICVTSIPSASLNAVAEATLAALLDIWRGNPEELPARPGREIRGARVGVLGFGRVGRKVAATLQALGASVFPVSRKTTTGLHPVGPEKALKSLDALIVAIPRRAGRNAMNALLQRCPRSVAMVNLSGGEIVDAERLRDFLIENPRAHYAHLTFPDARLKKILPKKQSSFYPPFFSVYTDETSTAIARTALSNLSSFLAATPKNRVV